ncbi:MAG TPA: glycosyltransferase [Gemmatimonadaceae bacterium]
MSSNGQSPRRLRVLHVHAALYVPNLLRTGLRRLGHKSDTVAFGPRTAHRELTGTPDYLIPSKWWALPQQSVFLAYALASYDVFHFWAQPHIIPPLYTAFTKHFPLDLAAIKKAGKKIVWQSDGCYPMVRPTVWKTSIDPEVCFVCQTTQGDTYGHCSNNNTIHMNEAMSRYADLKFGMGLNLDFETDAEYVFFPVDLEKWHPGLEVPDQYRYPRQNPETVLIYHGVGSHVIGNRGNIKGTVWIQQAVAELKEAGYNVELMHIERVPNEEVRYYQAQADIVVDQLLIGGGGQTARECLALGKPVLTRIHPQQCDSFRKASAPFSFPPYVATDRLNLKENLIRFIEDRSLRERVGAESAEFARLVLAPEASAARFAAHYQTLF